MTGGVRIGSNAEEEINRVEGGRLEAHYPDSRTANASLSSTPSYPTPMHFRPRPERVRIRQPTKFRPSTLVDPNARSFSVATTMVPPLQPPIQHTSSIQYCRPSLHPRTSTPRQQQQYTGTGTTDEPTPTTRRMYEYRPGFPSSFSSAVYAVSTSASPSPAPYTPPHWHCLATSLQSIHILAVPGSVRVEWRIGDWECAHAHARSRCKCQN